MCEKALALDTFNGWYAIKPNQTKSIIIKKKTVLKYLPDVDGYFS